MADRDEETTAGPADRGRAARALRAITPPPGFEQRLARALDAAEAEEAQRKGRRARDRAPGLPDSPGPRRWGTLLVACPAAAVAVLAVVLLQRPSQAPADLHGGGLPVLAPQADGVVRRFEERMVTSGAGGEPAWVDLDLWTHYHGDKNATVHLDAPSSVRVKASEHSTVHAADPQCGEKRCVHRFVTRTAHREGASPVRIGLDTPGKYHIHIEHASPGVRVSEVFVVNVTP
jgi:hypothetical protein